MNGSMTVIYCVNGSNDFFLFSHSITYKQSINSSIVSSHLIFFLLILEQNLQTKLHPPLLQDVTFPRKYLRLVYEDTLHCTGWRNGIVSYNLNKITKDNVPRVANNRLDILPCVRTIRAEH